METTALRPTPSPPSLPPLFPSVARSSGTRVERLLPLVQTLRKCRWGYLRPDFVAGSHHGAIHHSPEPRVRPDRRISARGRPVHGGRGRRSSARLSAAPSSSSTARPTRISVMVGEPTRRCSRRRAILGGIILLTLMVGAIQFLAGLLRAGSLARFVSEPGLTGYTAGAGLYIVINQAPSFLGNDKVPIPATVSGFALPRRRSSIWCAGRSLCPPRRPSAGGASARSRFSPSVECSCWTNDSGSASAGRPSSRSCSPRSSSPRLDWARKPGRTA